MLLELLLRAFHRQERTSTERSTFQLLWYDTTFFLFRKVHKSCLHNQNYFRLMIPGSYYLNYFKIYGKCTKYLKKTQKTTKHVTEEVTAKLPALRFYLGQPINRTRVCCNNKNAQCNTSIQLKVCEKNVSWGHATASCNPEAQWMVRGIWGW